MRRVYHFLTPKFHSRIGGTWRRLKDLILKNENVAQKFTTTALLECSATDWEMIHLTKFLPETSPLLHRCTHHQTLSDSGPDLCGYGQVQNERRRRPSHQRLSHRTAEGHKKFNLNSQIQSVRKRQ